MVFTMLPGAAFAAEQDEITDACICDVLCDTENVNEDCPASGMADADLAACLGSAQKESEEEPAEESAEAKVIVSFWDVPMESDVEVGGDAPFVDGESLFAVIEGQNECEQVVLNWSCEPEFSSVRAGESFTFTPVPADGAAYVIQEGLNYNVNVVEAAQEPDSGVSFDSAAETAAPFLGENGYPALAVENIEENAWYALFDGDDKASDWVQGSALQNGALEADKALTNGVTLTLKRSADSSGANPAVAAAAQFVYVAGTAANDSHGNWAAGASGADGTHSKPLDTLAAAYGKITGSTGVIIVLNDVSMTAAVSVANDKSVIITGETGAPMLTRATSFQGDFFTVSGTSASGGSTLTLEKLIVDGNKANITAAVKGVLARVQSYGTLNVAKSATLQNNKSSSYGTAVYVNANGTLNLAGTVTKNEGSGNGGTGAIMLAGGSAATVSGSVTDNMADTNGGAFHVGYSGSDPVSLTLDGATITGNVCNRLASGAFKGGALMIYSGKNNVITLKGETVIKNNTNAKGTAADFSDDMADNVYLNTSGGESITVGGLTTGAYIGVYTDVAPSSSADTGDVKFATGAAKTDIDYFHSDNASAAGVIYCNGVNADEPATSTGHGDHTSTGGNLYLSVSAKLAATPSLTDAGMPALTLPDRNIDEDAYYVLYDGSTPVSAVVKGSELKIAGGLLAATRSLSGTTLTLKKATADTGAGAATLASSTFLYVAGVANTDASTNGGTWSAGDDAAAGTRANPLATVSKAYEKSSGTGAIVVLNDLTVSATTAFDSEKNVTIVGVGLNSTTTVTRAVTLNNAAVFNATKGSVTIVNITLDGNAAWDDVDDLKNRTAANPSSAQFLTVSGTGSLILEDGAVIQNHGRLTTDTGGDKGGAVFITGSNASLAMKAGAVIKNCSVSGKIGDGGAIAAWDGGRFTMEGGELTGNTASRFGGAIRSAATAGSTQAIVTIQGGNITGNAVLGGETQPVPHSGGVCITQGELHMSGSPIIIKNYDLSGSIPADSNVGFYFKENRVIIDSALGDAADIGVNTATPMDEANGDVQFATGASAADAKHFHSDTAAESGVIYCNNNADVTADGATVTSRHSAHSNNTLWLSVEARTGAPESPAAIGRTAKSITIDPDDRQAYSVNGSDWYKVAPDGSGFKLQKQQADGSWADVSAADAAAAGLSTTGTGKLTFSKDSSSQGMEKGKSYSIRNKWLAGSIPDGETEALDKDSNAKLTTLQTSLIDAADVASAFEGKPVTDDGGDDRIDSESEYVTVTVVDGEYVVTLKQNVDHTVTFPDTWGNVTIDLNGKQINGTQGTEADPAGKPGLDLTKSGSTGAPGASLTIKDSAGTGHINGGNAFAGSGASGGAGVQAANDAVSQEVTLDHVVVNGGNGADNTAASGNGGDGGNGITGPITTTLTNATVAGGDAGMGGAGTTASPNGGAGGSGGKGIATTKPVAATKAIVSGGNAGQGGDATGTGSAGAGGTGGEGITTPE